MSSQSSSVTLTYRQIAEAAFVTVGLFVAWRVWNAYQDQPRKDKPKKKKPTKDFKGDGTRLSDYVDLSNTIRRDSPRGTSRGSLPRKKEKRLASYPVAGSRH